MPFVPHSKAVASPITGAPGSYCTFSEPQSDLGWRRLRQGALRWILIFGLTLPCLTVAFGFTQPQTTGTDRSTVAGQGTAKTKEAHRVLHTRHSSHRHQHKTTSVEPPLPAAVAVPPAPVPPAQQTASPARIEFAQGRLSVDASNSSLVDILNQISRQTGLTIEGLNHDKRIYGQYGPGSVGSTLNALLDGAGYNYVIIGGGGDGIPRKLILTVASSAPTGAATSTPVATPATASSEVANPSAPPQPKTPQEIFDEMRRMHPHRPPQ